MDIQAYIQSGVIESYVLGMASPQEVAELQQLCAAHPQIKQAVQDFELAIEQQAITAATAPASELKNKIFAAIQADETSSLLSSPTKNIQQPAQAKVINMSRLRLAAAASVILLIASTAYNVYLYNKYSKANTNYLALLEEKNQLVQQNNNYQVKMNDMASSLETMSHPNMKQVVMEAVPGKTGNLATVYWDMNTKDVYVLQNKLTTAPKDRQYQLWAIVNGKPVDAGVIAKDCNSLCKLKNIQDAQMFAITLEKEGGSPTPNLPEMYVAGKVSR